MVLLSQQLSEHHAGSANHDEREDRGDCQIPEQRFAPNPEDAGNRTRPEQRDSQRVYGGDQRADVRVDDAACQEELKRVGRNAEEIEQKGHGGIEAAKESQQAGHRELRVLARWYHGIREPTGEQNEAERQDLPGMRKIERRWHQDVGQLVNLG